ncbi:MAG: hypothetical protein ABIE70_08930 [bacterium]
MPVTIEPVPNLPDLVFDFDPSTRIVHITCSEAAHIRTARHLHDLFDALHRQLSRCGPERIYLMIDLGKIVIDPALKPVYAKRAHETIRKYVHPRGVARYGFQITRVTVKATFDNETTSAANIFDTRHEAEEYIHSLILQSQETADSPVSDGVA